MAIQNINNLYWLSGIIEGEGCFTTSIIRKKYKLFKIKVDSTDIDIATKVSKMMLGYTRLYQTKSITLRDKGHKKLYCVLINGNLAIQWMMTLYPLMGIRRRARIKEIINEWKNYNPKLGKKR